MDIGPIRRRFTAEPLHSPVPAEQAPAPATPALEQAGDEHPASRDAVTTARA